MPFATNLLLGTAEGAITGGLMLHSGVMTLGKECYGEPLVVLYLPLLPLRILENGEKEKNFSPMKMFSIT